MATVNKDFKVKHGLIVEGANATVDGSDIITADLITAGNGEGGNQNVTVSYDAQTKKVTFAAAPGYSDEDVKDVLTGSTQTNISITEVEGVLTITAENGVEDSTTDDLDEGDTNLYFTNQRALDATASAYDVAGAAASAQTAAESYADGLAVNYDVAGAAAAAQTAAESYADGLAVNYDVAGAAAQALSDAEDYADGLAVNYDAAGSAATAETNAKDYTDDLIGDATVDGTSGNTVTARIATAVSDLVNGAPELLDTLNELAAAIGDDENFATTIATDIGTKVSKAGDSMTGALAMGTNKITGLGAPSADADAATKLYVDTAEANAISHADALETDDVAEGSTNFYFTNTRAVDALEAVVPNFTAIEVNSVAKQVAATSSSLGSVVVTAYSFAKADYRTAKFIVKIDNGTHNEVTEVLLTLDSSDNIALTEYAIVGTNGSRGTITADVSGTDVRLRVDPVNDSTINVVGTLLA
jgi:hypothetical protein